MRVKLSPAFLWILLFPAVGLASSADPYEEMFGDIDEEADYLQLIHNLDTVLKQPIDLLKADREELSRLPWVSPWLADEIVNLRQTGELKKLDDLKKIDSVNDRFLDLIRPFVVVAEPTKWTTVPLDAMFRARVSSSPASSSYRDLKTYLRGEVRYRDWESGFIFEKDRYETQLNDYQSFYLERGFDQGNVVAGDFVMATGHGLVFSNPYGYSPSTVEPWRFSQGDFAVRPYTSVDENFGLRGVGLNLAHRAVDVCAVVSRTSFDASLDDEGRVKSLGTSGLHISDQDIQGEGALEEDLAGLALRFKRNRWGLAFDVSYADLNREFSPPRLAWIRKGGYLAGSLDLSLRSRESLLFFQGAAADGGGEAFLGGLAFDRARLEFLLLGRSYDQTYLSLHSRPFAFYSGSATGEEGLLTRIAFKPLPVAAVSIGSDLHQRRPADGGLSNPSGSESFLDLTLAIGKVTFVLAEKLLVSNEPPSGEGQATEERTRLRSRLDVKYRPRGWLSLRMRYENLRSREQEGSSAQHSTSDLLRLDVGLHRYEPFEIRAGMYTFKIGDYASRIYQYEPSVPYYPSIQMLKSGGSRWYCVLLFEGMHVGRLAAKFGRTIYGGSDDRSEFLVYYNLRT
jgi:hypothetical protein